MKRFAQIILKTLLGLGLVSALAVALAPLMLDRHYYAGPRSSHYDGGHFFNPDGDDALRIPPGRSRASLMWGFLTGKGQEKWPDRVAVKPTKPLAAVAGGRLIATWVGHATVLIQTEGLNILTDPNWSDTTGPFGIGPSRVAAPGVRFDDLPKIDAVLISHNHYDHLDVPTLEKLQARDHPHMFTGLGNNNLLARSGIVATAMDWGQSAALSPAVEIISTRNHHWGGRWGTDAKRALWTAFVIKTPQGNVFFAGDTGAGDMKWPAEAAAYGPIRLALIPIGAFRFSPGQMANGSHIGPVDAVRVFEKLGAQHGIAIHWGTFHLSNEAYDTPPKMLTEVMKCHSLDTARFAAVRFGVPNEIAALDHLDVRGDSRVDVSKCLSTAAIKGLR